MRIGLLSDAHGNPQAVSACLQKLKVFGVERIYFLGDAIGYLPGENQVLELLHSASVYCQKGNHEAMLQGEIPLPHAKEGIYRIGDARARLSKSNQEFVVSWPGFRVVEVCSRKILLVHGSPDNPLQGQVYPDADLSNFDRLSYDAVFMGNTHYPFVAHRQGVLVANVGSCGLPRDQGDLPAFAVYDAVKNSCDIFRFHLDQNKVIESFKEGHIAEEVHQCLFRKSLSPVFGQFLG